MVPGTTTCNHNQLRMFPAAVLLQILALHVLSPLARQTRLLALKIPDESVHEANKSQANQNSNIVDRCSRIPVQFAYPIRYTHNPTDWYRTAVHFEALFSGEWASTEEAVDENRPAPQTNGKLSRFKWKKVVRLWHYIREHFTVWNSCMQPLTYAYNDQVHRYTGEDIIQPDTVSSVTEPYHCKRFHSTCQDRTASAAKLL